MDHPQESTFEAFVIGALNDVETAQFVAHVSECDVCAKVLETEAKAELAIAEVHAASRATRAGAAAAARKAPTKPTTFLRASVSALALAAAIALFLLGRERTDGLHEASHAPSTTTMTVSAPRASEPIPLVVCPDGTGQEKCVEDAHRHGLYVSYPPWAKAPPFAGGRSGQGPNGSPFSPQQM